MRSSRGKKDATNLSNSSPNEEVIGGVSLDMSNEEIAAIDSEWSRFSGQTEFVRYEDYLEKVCVGLNFTRAHNINGEDFTKFVFELFKRVASKVSPYGLR